MINDNVGIKSSGIRIGYKYYRQHLGFLCRRRRDDGTFNTIDERSFKKKVQDMSSQVIEGLKSMGFKADTDYRLNSKTVCCMFKKTHYDLKMQPVFGLTDECYDILYRWYLDWS